MNSATPPSIPRSQNYSQSCWNTIGVKGDRSCPELTTVIHCRNCAVYSQGGRQLLDRQPPAGYQQEWTRLLAETTETRETGEITEITEITETNKAAITSNATTDKQEITGAENSPEVAKGQKVLSVVVFRLQKEWLALKASIFKEVTELSVVRTLPHRSNEIFLGLVSIRGELQLCISLNHLLGLETGLATGLEVNSGVSSGFTAKTGQKINSLVYQRLVVVEREGSLWVFPVDEIYGVQHFSGQDLRPAPVVISKAAHSYTQGIFDWQANQARYHVNYLDDELLFHTLNRRVL